MTEWGLATFTGTGSTEVWWIAKFDIYALYIQEIIILCQLLSRIIVFCGTRSSLVILNNMPDIISWSFSPFEGYPLILWGKSWRRRSTPNSTYFYGAYNVKFTLTNTWQSSSFAEYTWCSTDGLQHSGCTWGWACSSGQGAQCLRISSMCSNGL